VKETTKEKKGKDIKEKKGKENKEKETKVKKEKAAKVPKPVKDPKVKKEKEPKNGKKRKNTNETNAPSTASNTILKEEKQEEELTSFDSHSLIKPHPLYNKEGRIGIYTPEERTLILQKYNKKRQMRIWRKKIRYDCRRDLAVSRPRVMGRFVKGSTSSSSSAVKKEDEGATSGGNKEADERSSTNSELEHQGVIVSASEKSEDNMSGGANSMIGNRQHFNSCSSSSSFSVIGDDEIKASTVELMDIADEGLGFGDEEQANDADFEDGDHHHDADDEETTHQSNEGGEGVSLSDYLENDQQKRRKKVSEKQKPPRRYTS